MIKKVLATLLAIAAISFNSAAAEADGMWKIHPIFNAAPQNVVDAGTYVYYLVSNNLFRFDKSTRESVVLGKGSGISDVNVKQIYYNVEKNYMLVVYDNANIDIIKQDGKIVNVPNIKDAVMTTKKTINHVAFSSDGAYVASAFGYVVIDNDSFHVKESKILGANVVSAARVGNTILIATDNETLSCPVTAPRETLAQFSSTGLSTGTFTPINATKFFLNASGNFSVATIASDNSISTTSVVAAQATTVQSTASGFLASFYANKYYIKFDADGNKQAQTSGNAELFSSIESDGSLWGISTSGLRHVGVTSYFKPNSLSIAIPWHMYYNQTQNKLYVTSKGHAAVLTGSNQSPIVIFTLDLATGQWTNSSPTPAIASNADCFAPHPTDPNTYFIGTWLYGTYKVTNNKVAMRYDWTNSTLIKALNYYCHNMIAFDKSGNLWIVQTDNTGYVSVLPADKVAQSSVTAADWLKPVVPNLESNQRANFLITPNTDMKVFVNGDYRKPFFIWTDNGNPAGEITSRSFTSFNDQDSKAIEWTWIYDMKCDKNDDVWVGYYDGMFKFNPAEAFNADFRVTRIKTADGTPLLQGEQVNSIGIDRFNRKWVGTNSQGLFLISADGSEILKHFDNTNSMLSSNLIYKVYCNPVSNSVYVSTSSGFLEFVDGGAPQISDYSATYATPNPVPHNFTGYVTISKLMSDSYVNITDAAGNLIATTQATGTTAHWDVCDNNGARVATGTYYVCASTSDPATRNIVAKILVVK